MDGILYGIGTGPGDPELMTIKAVKMMNACDVIVLPISNQALLSEPVYYEGLTEKAKQFNVDCIAYQIAKSNITRPEKKGFLYLPMPMIKDSEILKRIHNQGFEAVMKLLRAGNKLAFLTLGDPTIYSTYLYIHNRVIKSNGKAKIINGIPSFCATAARLDIGLVENREQLHIIPASYGVKEALELEGTKVFMKAGKQMQLVKNEVKKSDKAFWMVENCGMEKEKVYDNIEDLSEEAGYYSLIIVKEKNRW